MWPEKANRKQFFSQKKFFDGFSTKANDKGSVFYNVTATLIPPVASALEMPMAAAAYADSVQDNLLGESGNGLLASL